LRRAGFYTGVSAFVVGHFAVRSNLGADSWWATFERLVPGGKGQQGDVACLLDGAAEPALVLGAHAGQTAGHNLAALGYEALQQTHIAVRDGVDLFGAELADLLAAKELAAATGAA
jgi:hypothetical protein